MTVLLFVMLNAGERSDAATPGKQGTNRRLAPVVLVSLAPLCSAQLRASSAAIE